MDGNSMLVTRRLATSRSVFLRTYAFEDVFDVSVDALEALGILGKLFLHFLRADEQGFQVRPGPLDFL